MRSANCSAPFAWAASALKVTEEVDFARAEALHPLAE
jgi:hypothetical protein